MTLPDDQCVPGARLHIFVHKIPPSDAFCSHRTTPSVLHTARHYLVHFIQKKALDKMNLKWIKRTKAVTQGMPMAVWNSC